LPLWLEELLWVWATELKNPTFNNYTLAFDKRFHQIGFCATNGRTVFIGLGAGDLLVGACNETTESPTFKFSNLPDISGIDLPFARCCSIHSDKGSNSKPRYRL